MLHPYAYYALTIGRSVGLGGFVADVEIAKAIGLDRFSRTIADVQKHTNFGPLEQLGMPIVQKYFDRLAKLTADAKASGKAPPLDELRQVMVELFNRLEDGLEEEHFYHVRSPDKRFYDGTALIPAEIRDALGISSEDLEEAGKCYALGRYTAAVFHLMRVAEAVVKRLGEELNVTVTDKNDKVLTWGKILANMSGAVEQMPKNDPKTQDWSEAVTLLFHVKEAWRNETMHPKQTYTQEEAVEIFDATGAFAGRLAKLLRPDDPR